MKLLRRRSAFERTRISRTDWPFSRELSCDLTVKLQLTMGTKC